jgi:hypothetical protein
MWCRLKKLIERVMDVRMRLSPCLCRVYPARVVGFREIHCGLTDDARFRGACCNLFAQRLAERQASSGERSEPVLRRRGPAARSAVFSEPSHAGQCSRVTSNRRRRSAALSKSNSMPYSDAVRAMTSRLGGAAVFNIGDSRSR